jgi:2,3-bisphosphoglycerate-independent phosphoglycerate mutase
MTLQKRTKFVVLAVPKTPNMDRFWSSYPHTQLEASGEAVGLPRGDAGNTETGHLNLGAGRIVYQDLERINMAIADGSFFSNSVFLNAFEHAKQNNSKVHLMGLIGAGGVHSNLGHLIALIQLAKKQNYSNVFIHLFTDGRDSPPTASLTYINQLREIIKKEGVGTIASIIGRYWAMDRDRRWDRTAKAYFALTAGKGHLVKTAEEAIEISYEQGKTDEFIEPALITDKEGQPITTIGDNDACIFYNFRIDRPRQLTSAFLVKDFREESIGLEFDPYLERYEKTHIPSKVAVHQKLFERGRSLQNLYFATMTEYSKSLVEAGAKVALPPEKVEMPLGQILSNTNLKQLRMAESEKERFVTFYFNGQYESPFPGEERLITPSPPVSTYDAKPEMSAFEQTDKLLAKLQDGNDYAFVLINFANPDMVGHTGSIGPAVKACEVVDECIGKISNYISAYDGTLIIIADHGNVEEMVNTRTGEIDTEHSTNPVPFIVVSRKFLGKSQTLPSGILADIAPTILALLGIPKAKNMTGRNLLEELFK